MDPFPSPVHGPPAEVLVQGLPGRQVMGPIRQGQPARSIRTRVAEDIRGDHNADKPKLNHTLRLNDCMAVLRQGGYRPAPGFRGRMSFGARGQLVPDVMMRVTADWGEHPVACIDRSVHSLQGGQAERARNKIRGTLRDYAYMNGDDPDASIWCVCSSDILAKIVNEVSADFKFSVVTMLQEEVELGDPRDAGEVSYRTVSTDLHLFVEYERTAKTRKRVRSKIMPYAKAAAEGKWISVLFICETERAAHLFREEHRNLEIEIGVNFLLVTATLKEVMAGKKSGDEWLVNGVPIPLRHADPDRHLRAL